MYAVTIYFFTFPIPKELPRPPLPFIENRKKCPDFRKKGPNCVHPWLESSIQNVVLRVPKRKTSEIFPCKAFFSCVFDERFIKLH